MAILTEAANNKVFQLVVIMVVLDTIFGCARAIREHKFNSSVGIDGAIRKVMMLVSVVALILIDHILRVNLIGFIPNDVRQYIGGNIGIAELFALLYIAYEAVSILKNMVLCGLPVKRVWIAVRKYLLKYTDELPDADEAELKEATVKESEVEQ